MSIGINFVKPNILLLMVDQLQYQKLGIVDPIASTPNLDKLASKSYWFSNCFCSSPICVPSRSSMQTGLYPHECGVITNYGEAFGGHTGHLNGDILTVGQAFKENGYNTAYFGKSHLGGDMHALGYEIADGMEDSLEQEMSSLDYVNYNANKSLSYIKNYNDDSPFFLISSLRYPHPSGGFNKQFPLVEQYKHLYPLDKLKIPRSFYKSKLETKSIEYRSVRNWFHEVFYENGFNEDIVKLETQGYYTRISFIDELFGKILNELEIRGFSQNTIVAFISDHGEMLGAHSTMSKSNPFEESIHIPFILHIPNHKITKYHKINNLCVNTSLPATLMDAAGLAIPEKFSSSSSMLKYINTKKTLDNEIVFFEYYRASGNHHYAPYPFRACRTHEWKYIKYYRDNYEELFNLNDDPDEINDLSLNQQYSDIKKRLSSQVEEWWNDTGGKNVNYYESDVFKKRYKDSVIGYWHLAPNK